jgi:CxxC-x17-CxxC domain-containing protein
MSYTDKTLTCRDCSANFVFTSGEQEFYASRGLQNEPSRCPECRATRRNSRGRTAGPREMHDAVCANCGAATQVPFLPRGDKPVYCSDCFSRIRGESR